MLAYNLLTVGNGVIIRKMQDATIIGTRPIGNPTNVQHRYDYSSPGIIAFLTLFGDAFSYSLDFTADIQIAGVVQPKTNLIALAEAVIAVFPKANVAAGTGAATVDLQDYYTKEQVQNLFNKLQTNLAAAGVQYTQINF